MDGASEAVDGASEAVDGTSEAVASISPLVLKYLKKDAQRNDTRVSPEKIKVRNNSM